MFTFITFILFILLFFIIIYDNGKNNDIKLIDIDNDYEIRESKEIISNNNDNDNDKSIQIINPNQNHNDDIIKKQLSNEITIGSRIHDYILLERITYLGLKSQISPSYSEYESIPNEELDDNIIGLTNTNNIIYDNNIDNSRLISDGYEQDSRLFNGNLLTKLKEVKINMR
jgi:hypothetical protein